ncbi:MAG TPA: hypothetical protein PLV50_03460 [Smithella sp.]|nr:hypothetical protein [Smithella sp.]MDM7987050.1 hypothetical protein [Smithella sp.]HNY50112.1 hypothetical protein [Smithella sp.]HOG89571.1 hypothetical protein [Smithella sp.]HOU49907.1 hypothetical protein [Smithella sp.]
MPAPPIILELIERFERNIESYKSNGYNETQVRREFIDPFFEALGWDVLPGIQSCRLNPVVVYRIKG